MHSPEAVSQRRQVPSALPASFEGRERLQSCRERDEVQQAAASLPFAPVTRRGDRVLPDGSGGEASRARIAEACPLHTATGCRERKPPPSWGVVARSYIVYAPGGAEGFEGQMVHVEQGGMEGSREAREGSRNGGQEELEW